jgi:Domain of unknown function (DUF4105)
MQIKTFPVLKKGGYSAAFFLQHLLICVAAIFCVAQKPAVAAENSVIENIFIDATAARLAEKPTWASLLHVADGKANIQNNDFLLSHANFSLQQELIATIRFLYGGAPANVCRFPARYLWLRREIRVPALPIGSCTELTEFIQRAPADEIAVVFASENLAQPSSMMGHILLKLSGKNEMNNQVNHAVSFITDAGGINLPKLFFDSMVIGKAGFFTLAPYEEKLGLYLRDEQRSIWEVKLKLSAAQRELIQAHLIELKQTKLTYFFQKYNCATVIDFILSVGAGKQLTTTGLWLTPKDVVKRTQELGLIKESRVIPPNRWLIRALSEQLGAAERETIKQRVDRFEPLPSASQNESEDFIRLQLAKSYHAYRLETKQIAGARAQTYAAELNRLSEEKFGDKRLEATSFKNPIDTPQDSQVEFGVMHRDNSNYLRIGLTPASHRLEDDNRQYFGETELMLFDVSILKNVATKHAKLDRFSIYGAKSLIPRDDMSGGISGAIRIGLEQQRDANFYLSRTIYLGGSIGITKRIGSDVDLFALAGLGLSQRSGQLNFYAQPELGMIVREVFDMKSIFSVVMTANAFGDQSKYMKYRFVQSKFFARRNVSLHFTAESEQQKRKRESMLELSIKYLF